MDVFKDEADEKNDELGLHYSENRAEGWRSSAVGQY